MATSAVRFDTGTDALRAARYREIHVSIADTLSSSPTVADALPLILAAMGTGLGWQYAAFWEPDVAATHLSCSATWTDGSLDHLGEFESDTRQRVWSLGDGVIGAAWEQGDPYWVADIASEPSYLRPELALRAGLRSAVLVPIPTGLGVNRDAILEFFQDRPSAPDADTIEMLETVSTFVSQFTQLRSAEDSLRDLGGSFINEDVARELELAAAALGRAEDLKADVLATVTHELRTPLATIAGFASTMRDHGEQLTGEQKDHYLEIISNQTRRLQRLVGDLLTYARVERGEIETRPEVVDVAVAIRQTLVDLDADASCMSCPADLRAVADPDHLQQILGNFVGNALKYGEPPICVDATLVDDAIIIAVADAGTGVPDAFLPKLFGVYERATHGSEIDGTGLGLSIARGLARAQAGDAWYEPNEPSGARFCVRLPLA